MVFSSLTFLFMFLPLFFICYYTAGKFFGLKAKNLTLFLFSMVFYAWGEPIYVVLMVYSTVLDYVCGRMIEKGWKEERPKLRKTFLCVSLIGNIGLLCTFKYLGMFVSTLGFLTGNNLPALNIILPIGISFYTFQTMSYSIDVYRGEVEAQHNIINFAAYVVMFPQLIAGPVVRYKTIAGELNGRTETLDNFAVGLRRFIVGLGKKVIIANTMASTCDELFKNSPEDMGFIGSWVAIIAYSFQIFFDFSGYSDMAIGMGKMMGFNYLENFNYPYIANSVTDFWRRWHISMSTFFRDYVYIPLGGNRVSKFRWVINIAITWFLTGLWHGASWNFVLWGLYFGAILILEKLFLLKLLKKCKVLSHIWALFCIVYGWVIFTNTSVIGIFDYTKAMFGAYGLIGEGVDSAFLLLQRADVNTVFLIVFVMAILFSMPIAKKIKSIFTKGNTIQISTKLGVAYDMVLIVLLLICTVQLALGAYNPFIYFRF